MEVCVYSEYVEKISIICVTQYIQACCEYVIYTSREDREREGNVIMDES